MINFERTPITTMERMKRKKHYKINRTAIYDAILYGTCLAITISILYHQNIIQFANAISIKPADFDRFIMPCYLGGSSFSSYSSFSQQNLSPAQNSFSPGSIMGQSNPSYSGQVVGRQANINSGQSMTSNLNTNNYQSPYSAGDTSGRSSDQSRDSLSNLGQAIPRANTIDNFIALLSKIESANSRLANDPNQLIKLLLGRFRMDNYYYDVRTRTPISEQDHRIIDIIPAILNPTDMAQQQFQSQFIFSSDVFPENLLNHDEKCSMYFMLSHFIDKATPLNPPLSSIPIKQLTGSIGGQRPPVLQASGSGYPAQSANSAFSSGASGSRYPGPSPGFGSPATGNMNSFGSGLSNNPDYTGNNPYGMNVLQPNNQYNQNYNMRNPGQYLGAIASNSKNPTLFIDGNARSRDERQALEYGIITVANQENSAIVLNRVLMGILAAATQPQTIRQLSAVVYPTQSLTNTPKIDEEIDPLFAVTLADLWAISSIPKAGKPFDIRLLGDNGRWNDTMCPISFQLERSNSIRFTTAELIGGLDGFSLGMLRRRLMSMRKNIRLSEMLKIYYSKTGFRPQFAEIGVCNRGTAISTQLDDLHRQAENYLRLYQLNLPNSDSEIVASISRLDSFKDIIRQAANQYAPTEVCQDSRFNDPYPMNQQDQCEISKADLVTVLDTSPQANTAFMNIAVAKLAQKLGLSRQGSSMSILTDQQDTTGYAGTYNLNPIVRNSTNTAEIGCALVHDTSRTYQGSQITDPTRLIEMFERALINLDSEYITRQTIGLESSSNKRSTYVSSLFGQSDNSYLFNGAAPRNTGGAKVIIWFNYGIQHKPTSIASSPTNWNGPNYSDQNQYKFFEAKKYLRENFRGASILAVASSRDDVKAYVYNEEQDIFTDIPPGSSSASLTSDYNQFSSSASSDSSSLNGPADQLVDKLMQRMCDIPALFQYPMCLKKPSEGTMSSGYISPGRKQYWMMSPKTFFASVSVKMLFRVDGGRLRVCFGRMPKPDESAISSRQQQYQSGSISLGSESSQSNQNINTPMTSSSSSNIEDYYTGLKYGICKDVSPGQEIDFNVNDPCYKKTIAECEPFYWVIKEISNPGEGDPNYMCKDEGCKRFDQAKFTMTHTGVTCSSASKSVKANWLLIMISIYITLGMTTGTRHLTGKLLNLNFKSFYMIVTFVPASFYMIVQQVQAQQAGVHDFGQGRYGEKRGNFTPSEVLAIILLVMTILTGLALTIGLCYYVTKQNSRGMTPLEQDEH